MSSTWRMVILFYLIAVAEMYVKIESEIKSTIIMDQTTTVYSLTAL